MPAPHKIKEQLTKTQQEVYDALEGDTTLSIAALAQRLGRDRTTVRKCWHTACKKQLHLPTKRTPKAYGNQAEIKPATKRLVNKRLGRGAIAKRSPDEQAAAMYAAMDPTMRSIKEAAEEAGVSPAVMSKFMKTLSVELRSVNSEIQDVRMDVLQRKLGQKLDMAIDTVDQEKLDAASAKDLAIIIGIFTEKSLLLRGQPTQILQVEERRLLMEAAPHLIDELQRRHYDTTKDPISGAYSIDRESVPVNSPALRKQERSSSG
jgi:DNA-binding Lrp family transcriptional regulator